jgi:iron uptake system component EfeO
MVRRLPARTPFSAVVAIVVAAAIATVATGCSSSGRTPANQRITIASERCGSGWTNPIPGQETFVVANTDIVSGEAFLVSAATGDVYAYVDDLAPGSTATMRIRLGSGRYQFRCAMSDEPVAHGVIVTVPGTMRGGARPVAAVTDNELVPIAKEYDQYVSSALPGLEGLVDVLAADIRSGDLPAARTDWLPAHLAYLRLGAAYGAFGAADAAINGLSAGLPGGVTDPGFTGFHRIEYGLWHGQTAGALEPFAARLVADVGTLQSILDQTSVATLDLAIRSHEIVENALQFDLTGQSDYGSDSGLASLDARLDGTGELLTLLRPILAPRYPGYEAAVHLLGVAEADVTAEDSDGEWMPLPQLSTAQRERIDADVSGLASQLAPIASIAEPRADS